jgi:uncharacterized membrane protein
MAPAPPHRLTVLMSALRVAALIAATMTTGLMAGVFGLYQHTVMRGLARTDDRTFVGAFQAIDRAIINPWFMASFAGALILTAAAALLNPGRSLRPWILTALALYLAVVIITMAINVPMNDALKAAGAPDQIPDLAAVRAAFDETRWLTWNLIRTLATTTAFGALCWALTASRP